MANWFVDTTNGSDANDGTTAATGGGHGPVATITKAIGASGIAASGDTIYVAPGVYRETVTVGITPTVTTTVIADVRRSQAWAASTPNGPVRLTAWTTDDWSNPSGAAGVLRLNGKNFLTLTDFWFQGGSSRCVDAQAVGGSHDITFTRCLFQGQYNSSTVTIEYIGVAGTSPSWTFQSCIFQGPAVGNECIAMTLPTHSGDYASGLAWHDCLFYGMDRSTALVLTTSGALSGKPTGGEILGCTFAFMDTALITGANWKADGGLLLYGNLFYAITLTTVAAGASGQITEDFNIFASQATQTSNVTSGASSDRTNVIPLNLELGQSHLWGFAPRALLSPALDSVPTSAPVGWGSNSSHRTTYDLLYRPRPAGGGSATSAAAVSGTATSGAGSTLTDSGATWTTNAFALHYVVTITGGTGSGQVRRVKSNTGTVLTVVRAWATNPDATSTYTVHHAGAEWGAGALGRHDTAAQSAAADADGGTGAAILLTGPAEQDLLIPVDATSTTISVKVAWDSTHGDTTKPRAILLFAPDLGLAASEDATLGWRESKTATGTAGSAYETLTFTAVTPSAKGVLRVRLQSRPDNGNGKAFFDTIGIS